MAKVYDMLDGILDLLTRVTTKYDTNTNFVSFPKESTKFLQVLVSFKVVLNDIYASFSSSSRPKEELPVTLMKALDAFHHAIVKGERVLQKCATPNCRLQSVLFGQTYRHNLIFAKCDIDYALRWLVTITATSCTAVPTDTLNHHVGITTEFANDLEDCLREEQSSLQVKATVLNMIQMQTKEGPITTIPEQIVLLLMEKNVVDTTQDCIDQLKAIQKEKALWYKENIFFEREVLDWIIQLSLDDVVFEDHIPNNMRNNNTNNDKMMMTMNKNDDTPNDNLRQSIRKMLTCPISLEIVKDPVLLMVPHDNDKNNSSQEGKTPTPQFYDKESICKSLSENPMLEPFTNITYSNGGKLYYVDSLYHRQLLMEHYGANAYQKYNDKQFHQRYHQIWDHAWKKRLKSSTTSPTLTTTTSTTTRNNNGRGSNAVQPTVPVRDPILQEVHRNRQIIAILKEIDSRCYGMNRRPIDPKMNNTLMFIDQSLITHNNHPVLVGYKAVLSYVCLRNNHKQQAITLWKIVVTELMTLCDHCDSLVVDDIVDNENENDDMSWVVLSSWIKWMIGMSHYWGIGCNANNTIALDWYRKSADLGCAIAQYEVGYMYEMGKGVDQKNLHAARMYYRKSAQQGHVHAQSWLGHTCKEKGDLKSALVWYQKAADQGYEHAKEKVIKLEKKKRKTTGWFL